MKLIRGLNKLPQDWSPCVLTIGSFDGLHKGHQALVKRCLNLAAEHRLPAVVMTFEPTPKNYFMNHQKTTRLTNLRDKFFILQTMGVDYLLVLPFNKTLASITAKQFIQDILINRLSTNMIVIGDDFHFGKQRAGNFKLLSSFFNKRNYKVEKIETLTHEKKRISSSRIIDALIQNNLPLAQQLLGRPYTISGRIVKGSQRGQRLGFPTANIENGQKKFPLSGIFVVTVQGIGTTPLTGVASVGHRPMYPGENDVLEVHLFDFQKDIYQKRVTITFIKYLRQEALFSSDSILAQQIEKDVLAAKQYLKKHNRHAL